MSASGRSERGGAVLLAPSVRMARLGAVIRALDLESGRLALESLADLEELTREWPSGALLVLDADVLDPEDLGFVRRFVARHPDALLVAIGSDPQARVARALLLHATARWLAWPPDLEQLQALVSEATSRAASTAAARPASITAESAESSYERTPHARASSPAARSAEEDRALRAHESRSVGARAASTEVAESFSVREPGVSAADLRVSSALKDSAPDPRATRASSVTRREPDALVRTPLERQEIDAIQAILGGRPEPADPVTAAPPTSGMRSAAPSSRGPRAAATGSAGDRAGATQAATHLAASVPAARASPSTSGAREPRGPHATGRHMREQVADLADFAQRIELSLSLAREGSTPTEAGRRFDDLEIEVARLVQFARTLGFLVAPPGVGEHEFDLCELVHTTVAGAAARADAPRCQFRTSGTAIVRSDRRLLAQAFDAIFFLAARCTGAGEMLRAQVRREDGQGPPKAQVIIEFPAGPLESLALDQVLEPYGLRRTLPELGPNALAAAIAIIEGQGGHAELVPGAKNHLQWRVDLPAVLEPGAELSTRTHSTPVGLGGAPG